MSDASKQELDWAKKVRRLLLNPPSERIGFYTIGDCELVAYDKSKISEIEQIMDERNGADFCTAVEAADAHLFQIETKMNIESTAG